MKSNRALIGVACALSAFAIGASAYALRARDSSIRGWAEATRLAAEMQTAMAAADTETQANIQAANVFATAVLRRDAGLSLSGQIEPNELNSAVRDYVYRTNMVGPGGSDLAEREKTYLMLGQAGGQQMCAGMSVAFAWAMNKLGIPARTVQLAGSDFIAGRDRYQTHVTVEVLVDGKWQISDPTFNISVKCSAGGEKLSVPEAVACVGTGGKLIGVPGRTQIAGRSVAEYFAPYESFFVAYQRASFDMPAMQVGMEEYPEPGWLEKSLLAYPPTTDTAPAGQ